RVILEGAWSTAPYERFEIIEGTYSVDDVIGRRIELAFAPPVPHATLVGMRLRDVETLVPVLSVVGHDMSDDEKEDLAVVGDLISLGGNVYQLGADGELLVDGEPLPEIETDPDAIESVSA